MIEPYIIIGWIGAFVLGYAFHDWCRHRAHSEHIKQIAKSKGYEEYPCDQCGNYTMERTAKGLVVCDSCGAQIGYP